MKLRVSSLAEIFSFARLRARFAKVATEAEQGFVGQAVTLHSKIHSGMALRRQPRELRKFANVADTVIRGGQK